MYLELIVLVQVSLNDMDVLSVAQLAGDFLVRAGFVAYEANDGVGGILRDLAEESKLNRLLVNSFVMCNTCRKLTPMPREAPVMR